MRSILTTRTAALTLCALLAAGCGGKEEPKPAGGSPMPAHGAPAEQKPQFFDGIGKWHRAITTKSPEAQKWFDQGLTLLYAFNHDESIRSFREGTRIDPECAMCWWGVALANGPHINNPALAPDRALAAFQAIGKARAATEATPVEKEMIEALAPRYSGDPNAERGPLDKAYADAMRTLRAAHPDDADIATLFAESMMDLRPWDLWQHDGMPQPGTEELVAALEGVLAKTPDHPGACHFYVHAVEASPHPEKGIPAADRLKTLVPMAGHLVHMPAHIYVRVGRYEDAAEANRRAIAAENAYLAKSPQQDFYMMYVAHNHQFLSYAAMMQGNSAESIRAAWDMVQLVPPEAVAAMPEMFDWALPLPILVLARFGRWEEILKEPQPAATLPLSTAMWRYARGLAHAARGEYTAADAERDDLAKVMSDLPEKAKYGLNPARPILAIAHSILTAEIAQRTGKLDTATGLLEAAVAAQDALNYDEPPDWFEPVRHRYGALLLFVGRAKEAEAVYREDLKREPENGWALFGLAKALAAQGHTTAADEVDIRFKKAWAKADVKLTDSRFK